MRYKGHVNAALLNIDGFVKTHSAAAGKAVPILLERRAAMVDELCPNLFRIEIPLPDTPLKYLNSYVIVSDERNLIIDTGLNRNECYEAMMSGLDEVGVDLSETDYFITHLHADHFGLLLRIAVESSKVIFNRPDAEVLESWEGFKPMIAYGVRNGFPEAKLLAALRQHPAHQFGSKWVPEFSILKDGDTFSLGDYTFQCIATPGHSRGHTCLYEPHKKILVSGDHLLVDITPNIQCWTDAYNPLQDFFESLEKVAGLEVELVLPGHRRVFENHRLRIIELKDHHERRLAEILSILERGNMTAYEIASQMTWDIQAETWDKFPLLQQWFATGEAIAHLRYLEEKEKISQKRNGDLCRFILT